VLASPCPSYSSLRNEQPPVTYQPGLLPLLANLLPDTLAVPKCYHFSLRCLPHLASARPLSFLVQNTLPNLFVCSKSLPVPMQCLYYLLQKPSLWLPVGHLLAHKAFHSLSQPASPLSPPTTPLHMDSSFARVISPEHPLHLSLHLSYHSHLFCQKKSTHFCRLSTELSCDVKPTCSDFPGSSFPMLLDL
jgi:hypothetical protein